MSPLIPIIQWMYGKMYNFCTILADIVLTFFLFDVRSVRLLVCLLVLVSRG